MERRLGTLCALSLVMATGLGLAVAATPDEAPEKSTEGAKAPPGTPGASSTDLEHSAAKAAASGDVELARKQLETLVKSQPTRPDYRHRLAAMNAVSGKPALSEVQAAAVVALQPDFGEARRLAVVSRGWRETPLRRQPRVADIRAALGEGRIRTAVRWTDSAMEAAPSSEARGQLQRERARALLAMGRPNEAQHALKLAGAQGHSDAQMWFEMGESALQLGAREAAKFYFEMAAEVGGAKNSIAEQARRRVASLRSSGNQ